MRAVPMPTRRSRGCCSTSDARARRQLRAAARSSRPPRDGGSARRRPRGNRQRQTVTRRRRGRIRACEIEVERARFSAHARRGVDADGVEPERVGDGEHRAPAAERIDDGARRRVSCARSWHASRQALTPIASRPGVEAAVGQDVGGGRVASGARRAREAEQVRVAGAPRRRGAGRQAAHDLVEQQRHARVVGGAGDERALVDPHAAMADVALEEDGDAVVADAAHRRPRRVR